MKTHIKKLYALLLTLVYKFIYWTLRYVPVFKLYQPLYGYENKTGLTRTCDDRWNVFSKSFPNKPGSVLDIGCNIGYFTFKSAEAGHNALGVEGDYFNFTSCQAIKNASDVHNCSFIKHYIDPVFTQTMPHFDTVINLSVFHHWVKAYGLEEAKAMMQNLADKCDTLIFETGQSNEVGSQWPEILSFMGDDPQKWIHEFLLSLGFKNVEMIGTFPTGLTNVDRYLFSAKK